MIKIRLLALIAIGILSLTARPTTAREQPQQRCFLKDGDRWGFYGDSITDFNVYPRVIERVFKHFHPDANVVFFNNAKGGKQAEVATAKEAMQQQPTVVSIMLGMNDAINADWKAGLPMQPALDKYRGNIQRIVRGLKEQNVTVVLMTPTLTDENVGITIFRAQGTEILLREMGRVCKEIADREGVYLVDAQGVFEDLQENPVFPQDRLRYDGVHPSSTGAYRIAKMFWQQFAFHAPLTDSVRALSPEDDMPLDLSMTVQNHIAPDTATSLSFLLSAQTGASCRLTLSYPGGQLEDTVTVTPEPQAWAPKIPASAFPQNAGDLESIVVSAESEGRRAVFFVDISRNRVIPMKDGTAVATIATDPENPGSGNVASITITRTGKALNFEASIQDDIVFHNPTANAWPWSGDNISVYLDLRPAGRFGGIGFDTDVYQFWYQPREVPVFTSGFRPWYGSHLENFSTAYGSRTESGYTVGLAMDGWIDLHNFFDASKLDYIGFDISVADQDAAGGKKINHGFMKTKFHTFLYPNCFAIVDLNDNLKTKTAFNISVYH